MSVFRVQPYLGVLGALLLALALLSPLSGLPSGPTGPDDPAALLTRVPAPVSGRPDGETARRAPILIVAGQDSTFAAYYPEILKAEGLNLFTSIAADQLTADALAPRRVVLLATSAVSAEALAALEPWVRAGGALIAMQPGEQLLPLAGLKSAREGPIKEGYLLADPAQAASRGIAPQPLRIHGDVRLYEVGAADAAEGAGEAPATLARLSAGGATPLPYPAVTVRGLGRGHVAAFAFDLARSVVFTRQGNPLWANEPRGGAPPHRASDLFFPGYLDVARIGVPQADEQQRLLANLIVTTADAPLPRFWYLPNGRRAAIIMAGDDHATTSGAQTLVAKLVALTPRGCRLNAWECPRATAYLTPDKAFSPQLAAKYQAMGFELGVHVDTHCRNQDDETLARTVQGQLRVFRARYPAVRPQATHRIHCVVWNGWTVLPRIERQNGIRLDLNYYHWPPDRIRGHPGFLTGTGFPMPFVTRDGRVLDIYQAPTQLVNESGVPQRAGVEDMLERALGPEQFFGAFATHYDYSDRFADILIDAARRNNVPLITAEQMLAWTDGRNQSRIDQVRWGRPTLHFAVRLAPGAEGASVALPGTFDGRRLSMVRCGRERLAVSVIVIKGLSTAFVPARNALCEARYGGRGEPS